jgi:hypothetical protein
LEVNLTEENVDKMEKGRKTKGTTRYCANRIKISKDADPDRKYLCVIPTPDGEAFLGVLVFPDKVYGGVTGRELMSKYLSRNWRKGQLADTDAKKQSKYRNKPRYGNGRSKEDWDRVTRLGNEREDYSFLAHKKKLEELEGNEKGKQAYLDKLNRMKRKYRYNIGNQADCPSEKSENARREEQLDENEYDNHKPVTIGKKIDEYDEEAEATE